MVRDTTGPGVVLANHELTVSKTQTAPFQVLKSKKPLRLRSGSSLKLLILRLLPDHLLNYVSDNRQLELLTLVRLVHAKDSDRDKSNNDHREQEHHQETDWKMHQGGNHA
jgi:hypothetical protein